MIKLTVFLDIDDTKLQTAYKRRIEVKAPRGYTVKTRCTGWGRTLEDGSIRLDLALNVTSPPDLLPRVVIGGGR